MPISYYDDRFTGLAGQRGVPDLSEPASEEDKPTVEYSETDILMASYAQETFAGSSIENLTGDHGWLDNFQDIEGEEFTEDDIDTLDPIFLPYVDEFKGVGSNLEREAVEGKIIRERYLNSISEAHPIKSTLYDILVQGATPETYASLGLVPLFKGLSKAGRVAYKPLEKPLAKMGVTGKTALITGGVVGAETAAQEVLLQATQKTRDGVESVVNVTSSMILGTALGGMLGKHIEASQSRHANMLSRSEIEEKFDNAVRNEVETLDEVYENIDKNQSGGSMGAADPETLGLSADDLKPTFTVTGEALGKVSEGIRIPFTSTRIRLAPLRNSSLTNNITGEAGEFVWDSLTNPMFRILQNSKSVAAKLGLHKLAPVPVRVKASESGKFVAPDNAHSALQRDKASMLFPSVQKIKHSYQDYRARVREEGGKPMTYTDFSAEIYKANNRGDVSEIPEVDSSAKFVREKLWKPALEALQKEGVLPEDIDMDKAMKYIARDYDPLHIGKNKSAFDDIMEEQLTRHIAKRTEEAEAIVAKYKGKRKLSKAAKEELAQARKDLENIDFIRVEGIRNHASQVSNKIMSMPGTQHSMDVNTDLQIKASGPNKASSLKFRSVDLDDDLAERMVDLGFIRSDMETVATKYVHNVMRDIRLKQSIGDITGKKVAEKIELDYKQNRSALEARKDLSDKKLKAELKKLDTGFREDISDWYGMVASYTGSYTNVNPYVGLMKMVHILTKMGSMVESAVADMGRIFIPNTLARTHAAPFKALQRVVRNKNYEVSYRNATAIGVATDLHLSGRAATLADVAHESQTASSSGISQVAERATASMFKWNLSNLHNTTWETISSDIVTNEFMHLASIAAGALKESGKKGLSKAEIADLAEAGLTIDDAKTLWGMFERHGRIDRGFHIANFHEWVPQTGVEIDVMKKLQNAVSREVEILIITPGQDQGLFKRTNVGGLLQQFKGFGQAALMRSVMVYEQRLYRNPADLQMYLALTMQLGLGAAISFSKQAAKAAAIGGVNPALDWTVGDWARESVDRSGIIAPLMDAYNSKLQPVFNTELSTRFARRNVADRLTGPTGGLFKDIVDIGLGISSGDIDAGTAKAVRRLMPFNNMLGLKYLVDGGINYLED